MLQLELGLTRGPEARALAERQTLLNTTERGAGGGDLPALHSVEARLGLAFASGQGRGASPR